MRRSPRRRYVAAALGALLMAGAVVAGIAVRGHSNRIESRPPGERPELLLLTGLPIVFPEEFTLEDAGSPALTALQGRYRVEPISVADRQSLDGRKLLLMAQPRAQPAEVLVELDEWVRQGGRVLLLADPMLQWPSERPLGDVARAPLAFADTGLLGRWGLRLDLPDEPGPKSLAIRGGELRTSSPGRLVATSRNCSVGAFALVASCKVGKGQATVIADADFLNVPAIEGVEKTTNLGLLLDELARLEPDSRQAPGPQTYPQPPGQEQE